MAISCSCGARTSPESFFSEDRMVSRPCPNSGLKNHRSFPPFADIPDDNELDEEYLGFNGIAYSETRHWCIFGEIVYDISFGRPRVILKTRFGEEVGVHFHLHCDSPTFFDWSDLKIGSTMGILYPFSHQFMDMSVGIREENPDTVMVFPSSLDSLTKEVDIVAAHSSNTCDLCGKGGSSQCGRCKGPRYCSKECQLAHWSQGHKKLCKHWPLLQKLVAVDFTSFKGSYDWTFVLKPPLSPEQRQASADRCKQEFLGKVCPGQSLGPLRTLLDRISEKVLLTDPISAPIVRAQTGPSANNYLELKETMKTHFLFKSLMEFCDLQSKSPDTRTHVVDLRRNEDVRSDMIADLLLSSIPLALPKWQREEKLRDILFFFEVHAPWPVNAVYKNDGWEIDRGDTDSEEEDANLVGVADDGAGVRAYWSDETQEIAEAAQIAATANPSFVCLRVLRVTGVSRFDSIKKIATENVASNVFTLWIREDIDMFGTFRAPRPELSLIEQLFDCSLPAHADAVRRGASDLFAPGSIQCISCSQRKKLSEYSKSQLEKEASCCIQCIQRMAGA